MDTDYYMILVCKQFLLLAGIKWKIVWKKRMCEMQNMHRRNVSVICEMFFCLFPTSEVKDKADNSPDESQIWLSCWWLFFCIYRQHLQQGQQSCASCPGHFSLRQDESCWITAISFSNPVTNATFLVKISHIRIILRRNVKQWISWIQAVEFHKEILCVSLHLPPPLLKLINSDDSLFVCVSMSICVVYKLLLDVFLFVFMKFWILPTSVPHHVMRLMIIKQFKNDSRKKLYWL